MAATDFIVAIELGSTEITSFFVDFCGKKPPENPCIHELDLLQ